MKQNSVLRKSAKAALSGHWASAVLFVLLYGVVYFLVRLPNNIGQLLFTASGKAVVFSMISLVLALLFLPMKWSLEVAFLSRLREKNAFSLRLLCAGYSDFGRVFSTLGRTLYCLLESIVCGSRHYQVLFVCYGKLYFARRQ